MPIEPFKFEHVFQAELNDIRDRRKCNDGPELAASQNGNVPTTDYGLTGLALSGGGVRAASVSLGVLQALNAKGVIRRIDYLSTVSGGGYIGTFMTICMSLNTRFPFGKDGTDSDETAQTKHLRDNSRYLVANGLPSIVSAIAVYLRGIVMNALILLPFMLGLSALLIVLSANKTWIVDELMALLPFWRVTEGATLPITAYASLVLLALWILYAVVVSVARIKSLNVRRRLSWFAGMILFVFAIVAIAEFHVWLLGKLFDQGHWDQKFKALQKLSPWIASIAAVLLPFIQRLGAAASKETGGTWGGLSQRVLSTAILLLLAAIVPAGLWLGMMTLAHQGISDATVYATWYAQIAIVLVLTWPFLSVNSNSLHQLYRDRLGRAFLMPDPNDPEKVDNFCLSKIEPTRTPYHLVNAALNVPGSRFANRRGRNADFFLFSRRFIGSEATDYVKTEDAERVVDRLNIGTAMAISGAAAAPNMGMASIKPLSPTIAFLNIRLGRWIQHPHVIRDRAAAIGTGADRDWWFRRNPGPRYLLREAFSKSGMNLRRDKTNRVNGKGFLFLSDGGHIENLGVYELLRRRCKLIIAVDAEADPNMACGSLVQLERFARIDLDTRITINWRPIGTRTREVGEEIKNKSVKYDAGPHVALGVIDYPAPRGSKPGTPRENGILVYIKASLSGDENDYILSYKDRYPLFPHESTADQLFSEEQLEVYRSLGEHMARHFLDGNDAVSTYQAHSGLRTQVDQMLMLRQPAPKPIAAPAPKAP
jgi:hypothetical protein